MAVASQGPKMNVHNGSLYVEIMEAADWSQGNANSHHGSRRKGKDDDEAAKQREMFQQKQEAREAEFRHKFDVAKRETERRQRERTLTREKEFERRFAQFQQTNATLVQEVAETVQEEEIWRQRQKERLYNEWTLKVFQPMQDQIDKRLSSLTTQEIEETRRSMFQAFLDESNKKTNGLFRDIIIESDYDPIAQEKASSLRYKSVRIATDPTKNRSTRESLTNPLPNINRSPGALEKQSKDSKARSPLAVTMWDRMESTPYGRYSNEKEGAPKVKRAEALKSTVRVDHYDVLCGQDAQNMIKRENNVRGKRMVPRATMSSEVAQCFKFTGEGSVKLPPA